MAEAGFPEIECDARIGFLARVGTPRQIVALLNREIGNIVAREGAAGQVRIRAPNAPEEADVELKSETHEMARRDPGRQCERPVSRSELV
jgi:hypothetical protein